MRHARIAGGVLVSFVGLVWTLQGLGSELAPQSFMTNSGLWVVLGLATMVGGGTFAWWSWRQRP